jgi:hypothetical protein
VSAIDWSQFDPELLARNIALREANADSGVPLHPARCGPCDDCLEFIKGAKRGEYGGRLKAEYARREFAAADRKLARTVEVRRRRGRPPALTVKRFLEHAQRFGTDGVLETARAYLGRAELADLEARLLVLGARNGKPKVKRQRRTTRDLAGQVIALRGRGFVPAAIADLLNLSDRRVAEILAKSRTSLRPPDFPLNQAKKNAAKAVGQHPGHPGRNGARRGAPDLEIEQPPAGRRQPAGRSMP